jgi:serine protease Do
MSRASFDSVRPRSVLVLALASAAALVVGASVTSAPSIAHADDPTPWTSLGVEAADGAVDTVRKAFFDEPKSLSPIVKQVSPAVVAIRAFATPDMQMIMPFSGQGMGDVPMQLGIGSGFIVAADGLVVTNHHVVARGGRFEVKLTDGRRFAAKVVGSDPHTDLALLRLEGAKGLPVAELGSSKALEVGDWVLAIGTPMGLEQTVTRGIISAKGRGDLGLYRNSYVDFVQTDAAISPGSSGGPLFDLAGKVVAVNTAVDGMGRGLGFAVPVDQLKIVLPQLEQQGKVERGWLGVSGRDVEPALGAFPTPGAVLGEVYADTPAAKGGLRKGDRIVAVNGVAVENFADLRGRIAEHRPKAKVDVEVDRDGSRVKLVITLGELPNEQSLAKMQLGQGGLDGGLPALPGAPKGGGGSLFEGKPRLGVDVERTSDGVVVRKVEKGSVAEQLGIVPGDVLQDVNGTKVTDPSDVAKALENNQSGVSVNVRRGNGTHSMTIQRW